MENWRAGDRILVARQEWGGNIAAMHIAAARAGARIEAIPCDDGGMADPAALEAMIDERVRLISVTWLPANGGLINPAAAIGAVARRHGISYFVDAAQAVGQLPIDVREVGCDVLTGVGRKALRGPRETALLYIRQDFLPRLTPAWVDTHSAPLDGDGVPVMRTDAARFEPSERSYALRYGLANALREALDIGIENVRARMDRNARALRSLLADVPGVDVLDQGARALRPGVVRGGRTTTAAPCCACWRSRVISISSNGPAYTPLDMQRRAGWRRSRAPGRLSDHRRRDRPPGRGRPPSGIARSPCLSCSAPCLADDRPGDPGRGAALAWRSHGCRRCLYCSSIDGKSTDGAATTARIHGDASHEA